MVSSRKRPMNFRNPSPSVFPPRKSQVSPVSQELLSSEGPWGGDPWRKEGVNRVEHGDEEQHPLQASSWVGETQGPLACGH